VLGLGSGPTAVRRKDKAPPHELGELRVPAPGRSGRKNRSGLTAGRTGDSKPRSRRLKAGDSQAARRAAL
jgi:hypothetical protein